MNTLNHKRILDGISDYLDEHPELRFTQALYNLGINEFKNKDNPEVDNFCFRDNYNDSDKSILAKINKNTI